MDEETKVIQLLDADRHERSKRIGWLDFEAIESAKVLVVGAGALGNEVIKNLVLSGFRKISLVDMDYIVLSNLNRCVFFTPSDADERRAKVDVVAEGALRLVPDAEIKCYTSRIEEIGEDFIPSHDLVFGCLDNLITRVHVNTKCYNSGTPYIDGGTNGFRGKVQVITGKKGEACFGCGLNRTHWQIMEKRFSCTGDDVFVFEDKIPAEITTTAVVSALQVRESLKIISGEDDKVLDNVWHYDGIKGESFTMEIPFRESCPCHMQESE
jgi:molybdopterin-synthase adenylyltransferase